MYSTIISVVLWLVKPKQVLGWIKRLVHRKQPRAFALSSRIDQETFNRKHNLHVDYYRR